MAELTVTNEVSDYLAYIEIERKSALMRSGSTVATGDALGKLQILLDREKENLRRYAPDGRHADNIYAVALEMSRVRRLTDVRRRGSAAPASMRAGPGPAEASPQEVSLQVGPLAALRLWGRRVMRRE